ncbi:MAG: hypothetical protein KJ607_13800 [Bacteroidetes bacterium]|nr:hypothetical protein [Bacteroidota bacterium]
MDHYKFLCRRIIDTTFPAIIQVCCSLLFLGSVISLPSCSVPHYITIEVLHPSESPLSHSVRKIVLVESRAKQYYTHISSSNKYKKGNSVKSLRIQLADLCLDSLESEIGRFTRFDTVIRFSTESEVDLSDAKDIASRFDADGVVIFGGFWINIERNLISDYEGIIPPYQASLGLYSLFYWELYDARKHEIVDHIEYQYNDTWWGSGSSGEDAMKELPSEDELVNEVVACAGKYAGEQMVPSWIPEERVFYSLPGKEMRTATQYATGNKWEEAAEIWKNPENHIRTSLAGKCLVNLALAAEMQGDLDEAYKLATKAYKDYRIDIAKTYSNHLHERIIDQYELQRQLK